MRETAREIGEDHVDIDVAFPVFTLLLQFCGVFEWFFFDAP